MRSEAALPGPPEIPRSGKSKLPDQRTLLTWLFAGRLVLAVGILLAAGLVSAERPYTARLVTGVVVIALVFTAYGGWSIVRRIQPSNGLLLIQALVDLGLVTTIVHFAGQPQSAFPALYVLVVAAYALLMPPAWGALTAVLASALFLGDAFLGRATEPDSAFWAQMIVFNVVFAIVAVLGHRLREAGMEQETLAIELKRVIAGDGPLNAQRIAHRRRADSEGAWVREAAAAHAAKQARKEAA